MENINLLRVLLDHRINSKAGYRIYFREQMLIMKSGKFVWEKEGHAKNALYGSLKDTMGWHEYYDEKTHEGVNQLLDSGVIKIEYYEQI